MQYTYQDFFPLLKTVFELISFDTLTASAIFVCLFDLFHLGKKFLFEDFFIWENKNRFQGETFRVRSGE